MAKSVVYARTLPDELDEAVMKRYLNGEETHSIHKFEQYNVTAGMAFKRYAFCRASLMRAVELLKNCRKIFSLARIKRFLHIMISLSDNLIKPVLAC